ncbi:zinc finger BED domain-containing protein RICESLEEPER, partial [Trifolium medium]|nr:zinc finger BED domain-containing protein RICESLEEPER [Trifolium medium]
MRWNSTYLMLAAAEKYQVAFDKLEDTDAAYRGFFDDDDDSPPSNFDWENVRAFVNFLMDWLEVQLEVDNLNLNHSLLAIAYEEKTMEDHKEIKLIMNSWMPDGGSASAQNRNQ